MFNYWDPVFERIAELSTVIRYSRVGNGNSTQIRRHLIKRSESPPNLFFTDQGRELWGQLWQEWTAEFPQGRSVLLKTGA